MAGSIEGARERADAFAREIQKLQERVGRGEISPEKFDADVEQVKREFGWTGELPGAGAANAKARSATAFEDGKRTGPISLDGKGSAELRRAWASLATDIEAQMKTVGAGSTGADLVQAQREALRARERELMHAPFGDRASVSVADTIRVGVTAAYASPAKASALIEQTVRDVLAQLRQAAGH